MAAQNQCTIGIFLVCLSLVRMELTNEVLQDDDVLSTLNSTNSFERSSFSWRYSNWSSCSTRRHGTGGLETRNASCVTSVDDGSNDAEEEEVVAVDDDLCQLSLRLPLKRSCDMTSCQTSWNVSEWSRCLPWRGLVRTRSVSCQPPDGDKGGGGGVDGVDGGGVVDDGGGPLNGSSVVMQSSSLCVVSEKPEILEPCEEASTTVMWFTGPWSECNSSCGVGNRSREVWCVDVVGLSINLVIVSDQLCAAVERPVSHEQCNVGSCFGVDWVVSSWSGCNRSCEQQFETRLVLCVGKDGRRHPNDVICDQLRRPDDRRLCKWISCGKEGRAKWFASEWSTCSVSCGRGRQFRSVFCAMEDTEDGELQLLRLPDDSCSVRLEKMEEERQCLMDECQTVSWITSSFGKCSSSCGEGLRNRFVWCLIGERLSDRATCNTTNDDAPSEFEDCYLQPCPDDPHGVGSCVELEFGCCSDGLTPADGPDQAGCPVYDSIPFGFCQHSEFGCCSDQMTPAEGPFAEGCPPVDCQDSEFGCCPDGQTASLDDEQKGCPSINLCESSQFGCCPDGITPSNGPDQSTGCLPSSGNSSCGVGLNCQLENQTSPCHDSQFGCCPDGTTVMEAHGAPCNSFAENLTIAELSNNFTDSYLQSAYNGSDATASGILRMNDSNSSYPADLDDDTMTLTTVDQESSSGDAKDDDDVVTSDLTLSEYDDKNLTTSVPTLSLDETGGMLTSPSIHLTSEEVGPCSAAPYGCCPDGMTPAVGPENAGCLLTPRRKPGLCALPVSIGDCQEKHRVWYYNATVDQCFLFYYTGCGGNANRFTTEYQCNQACRSEQSVPTSLAICVLPIDRGPCNVPVTKWRYNYELGQCQPFTFGGCEGNDNKFDTRRECEGVCSVIDICRLPVDVGNCSSDSSIRFYFSPSVRNCLPFTYGGCHGNANRFGSFRDCSIVCKQTYNLQVDLCHLPSDPGPCKWLTELFYFNATLGTCQKFFWGGCGGNRNRFATMEKCLESCASGSKLLARLPAKRLPGQPDVCLLKSDPGPCKAYQPMWYFEPMEKACRRFLYGGCGGNANLFETWDQCVRHCQTNQSGTDPQPTTSGLNELSATVSANDALSTVDTSGSCLLPRDPGPCIAHQLRWYFDQLEARCQQFHYGGCQGNDNNYDSSADCEVACHEFIIHVMPDKQFDTCSAPRDPGPCFADFLRYHWDGQLSECRPFIYGGCQGNDNNFVSQDDCYAQCGDNFSQPVEEEKRRKKRMYKPGDCYETMAVGASSSCGQSVRWYFDMISGDCLPFYYKGCDPEGNNFNSHDDCISFCLKVTELCGIFQCDLECEYGHSRGPDGCLQCQCNDPCESFVCGVDLECHLGNSSSTCTEHEPCQLKPICKPSSKSGACPLFADNWSEVHGCKIECIRDTDCSETDKCCYTGCGRICVPLLPKEAPSIEDDLPSAIVTTVGHDITLPCKALGAPLPQVNWFRNGNPIVAGWLVISDEGGVGGGDVGGNRLTVSSDGSLVIRSISLDDSGSYTCRAFNTIGSATRDYTVIVHIPVRILDVVPRNQTVKEGESARFECVTEGEPVPAVTWYRDNERLNETSEHLRANGSILMIYNVLPQFQGTYECVASNDAGIERQSVMLSVLGIYYVNIATNSSGNMTAGTWLHLLCNISGAMSQDMVISWTKDGNAISSESKHLNLTTNELIIDQLETTDSGEYSCKVRRGEEEVEAFVDIQVTEAPDEVPEDCTDEPRLADCALLIQANLCLHFRYRIICCRSCFLAGKLPR